MRACMLVYENTRVQFDRAYVFASKCMREWRISSVKSIHLENMCASKSSSELLMSSITLPELWRPQTPTVSQTCKLKELLPPPQHKHKFLRERFGLGW